MATKHAIIGLPNTGKSHSRRNLNAEEVVILAPSRKSHKIKHSDGSPLKPIQFVDGKGNPEPIEKYLASAMPQGYKPFKVPYVIEHLKKNGKVDANWYPKVQGDYLIVKDLMFLESILAMIDKHMPHKKIVFISDFTHFLSYIVSRPSFINRKAGGDAYAKFYELAASTLDNFLESIDFLRDDLIVFTEYHSVYNEQTELYEIFVPAGKMLKDKFIPESYYDNFLFTYPEMDEDKNTVKSWNFVVNKFGPYDGRNDLGIKEALIPNDLVPVVEKIREVEGIK